MLIANGAVTIFFVVFFGYTFVGRAHIDRLARDFVVEQTMKISDPAVDHAAGALKTKLARELLTDEQIAVFQDEIAAYRQSPEQYIVDLTDRTSIPDQLPPADPLVARIGEWKQRARLYYDQLLSRLVHDLRIFAGSNVVAAGIAVWAA